MRVSFRQVVVLLGAIILGTACGERPDGSMPGSWKLEELTDAQLAALSRDSTIFMLTFGNLEVHGPHLPLGTDQFVAVGFRDGLIQRLHRAYPEYEIVLFPVVPLGEGAVEELAGHWDHTASFAVRYETLRNVAVDLGAAIARKGFQNIFLIHAHGGFLHNIAFSEAADFVSERFQVRMVNIASHVFAEAFDSPEVMGVHLGPGWLDETGVFHHGGAGETGKILFLRPELVRPDYQDLQPFIARDLDDAFDVSGRPEWQGYWGHPAQATASLGEDLMDHLADSAFRIAELVLRGEDVSHLPLYPEPFLEFAEARAYFEALQVHHERETVEIEEWFDARAARNP